MPLESATYIGDLVATDPIHTDGINNADAHLRLIKSVLQSTFPNIDAAVTGTPAQLNAVAGVVVNGVATVPPPASSSTTGGTLVLAGAGAHPSIKLINTGSGLGFVSGTTTIASVDSVGDVNFAANLSAASIDQGGFVLVPHGIITMWSGSIGSIPSGWLLCDGTSGTPDLRDRFVVGAGNLYGPAATGGTTSGTATTGSAGAHTHGGTTGAAGGFTVTGGTDNQGGHNHTGNTLGHVLTTAEMPSHTHTEQFGDGSGSGSPLGTTVGASTGVVQLNVSTGSTGGDTEHQHGIPTDGVHFHNLNTNPVAAHAHTISSDGTHTHTLSAIATLPPYYALAYIMKS